MRTLLVLTIALGCLAMTPALEAQASPAQPQAGQAEETLTGCLSPGPTATSFLLKTEDGREISIVGSVTLAKHLNQIVKLFGKMEGEMFRVGKVERVADSCKA